MGAVGRLCLALVPEAAHLTGTPCSSERHRMNVASATEIGAWVTTTGLAGASELDLLRGFCERLAAAGFPLARATVLIDTLHPVHEGRAFRWRRDQTDEPEVLEYGRTHAAIPRTRSSGVAARSTTCLRPAARTRAASPGATRLPAVEVLRAQGHTD